MSRASSKVIPSDPHKRTETSQSRGFTRRYFVGDLVEKHSELLQQQTLSDDKDFLVDSQDMPESKHNFLKYFDVDLEPAAVKMEDAGPGSHLRIYYSDFLDSTEHEATKTRLIDAWNEKKDEIEKVYTWVCSLQPRSKTDAFPMLLMVQEMLKSVLGQHMQFHFEKLNIAQERIELLEGDVSEQVDQIARLQEEVQSMQESHTSMQNELQTTKELLQAAERDVGLLQSEIKSLQEEIELREEEKKKMVQTFKEQNSYEDAADTTKLVVHRLHRVGNELLARKALILGWRKSAIEVVDPDHLQTEDNAAAPHVDAMAPDAARAIVRLLDDQLHFVRLRRAVQLELSESISEMELQGLLQLAAELVSAVVQVPHVYVAELVRLDDLGLLGEIGMFDRPAERRFLYVAASPESAFLLGNSLDPAALTHRHFADSDESHPEYLDVAIRDHLAELRFFRDVDRDALGSGRERYMAVPYFDRAGAVAGFIALDTMGASPAGAAAAEEPWAADLLHAVAEFLGRAAAESRGLADDYDDLRGPVFFARRLVEIANGRLSARDEPPDGLATVFLERYGFLVDLATRNRSALGEGAELPLPAKRYFVPREQLPHAQLGNLKDLRLTLQEELMGAANEAELRLLRAAERPPRETLKVWRAVFVLVGSADRDVLSTLEDTSWARVQALLADSRPARERLPRLMAGLNPLVPRNIERADNLEQVYHLAQGLVLTIDTSRLMTEGRLPVLLLEWVLVIFLIRQMESTLMAPENGD